MLTKKTLWISPAKDMSGYAKASRNYLRALQNEPNLVARSVRYDSGNKQSLSKELAELHCRDASNAEIIIQMLTPNEMRPVEGKRNIAMCCWETSRIPQLWVDQLNKFDKIIVPCNANKAAFISSGVTKPIEKIPFIFFRDEYVESNERFTIPGTNEETIIFYNISQWSPKKGIEDIIKAYYLAFQKGENVLLVLKGYFNMQNQSGDAQRLLDQITQIRNNMKLPTFPKIYVTDMSLSEKDIGKLHQSCDVYVNFSKGEGWGVPAYEALLWGNHLISPVHTGMSEYLPDYKWISVSHKPEPVYGMVHADPTLYTSLETWYSVDVIDAVESFHYALKTIDQNVVKQDRFIKNALIIDNLIKAIQE